MAMMSVKVFERVLNHKAGQGQVHMARREDKMYPLWPRSVPEDMPSKTHRSSSVLCMQHQVRKAGAAQHRPGARGGLLRPAPKVPPERPPLDWDLQRRSHRAFARRSTASASVAVKKKCRPWLDS